jgi:hypothetical protein
MIDMQGSRGMRAGVPPFMFRVFRYFMLSLSLMYNLGRIAYGGYMGDLMVIFSTARFIATALQFADHHWLCSNWSSFFESGQIRRYLWGRAFIANPILAFLNIFVFYLDKSIGSYSLMIYVVYNSIAISIFLFWLYWGEYIAGGLHSSRYLAARNAVICLTLDHTFYIAADLNSPYIQVNFVALALYIAFSCTFHWLLVREQRATKVLADDPDSDNRLDLTAIADSFEPPVCVDISTSKSVKYGVVCKTPRTAAVTQRDNNVQPMSDTAAGAAKAKNLSVAADKIVALVSQELYWFIFVYFVELCISGYYYSNYHTYIDWCPTFSFTTTAVETLQSVSDMLSR